MADPQKITGTKLAPITPEQPLFDMNDIMRAPDLTSATEIYTNATNEVSKQQNAILVDDMRKRSDLLTQTARQAQSVFEDNNRQTQNLTTAQSRRGQIEKIPPLVGRILGLFDKDYDWGYWNEQVRGAKVGLAANDQALTQLQMLSQLQESVLNNQMDMVKQNYSNITGQFDRALSMRQTQVAESQRLFENRLKLAGEKRADAHLRLAERGDARAAETQTQQNLLFSQGQQDRSIAMMPDELLKLASEGKVDSVPKAAATKELQQRESNDLSLKQAAINIKNAQTSGDRELLALADTGRLRFLNTQTAEVLTDMAEKAKEAGGTLTLQTDAGAVPFTVQELTSAAADRASDDLEIQKTLITRALDAAETANNTNIAMDTAVRISKATSSNGVSPEPARLLSQYLPKIKQAQQLGPGGTTVAAELSKKLLTEMDASAEKSINTFSAKQQPYVRAQFEDRASSPQERNDFAGDMIFNPSALNNPMDTKIASLWNEWATEAKGIHSVALALKKDEAGNTTVVESVDGKGEIMQTALGNVMEDQFDDQGNMTKPGIRTKFTGMVVNSAFQTAIADIASEQGLPWMKGVQSLIQFSSPNGAFDSGKFLTYLRDKYVADVEAGVIPIAMQDSGGVRPYDQQFLEYMQRPEFQEKVGKQWNDYSLSGQVVFESITGGNPLIGYLDTMYQIQQTFEPAYMHNKGKLLGVADADLQKFRTVQAQRIYGETQVILQQNPNLTRKEAENQATAKLYKQFHGME